MEGIPLDDWKRLKFPLVLYGLTWLSTTWVGSAYSGGSFLTGLWFSVPLMVILTCHEMGHFIQARRYSVSVSWPWFIPVPFPPFGTFGAVIKMDDKIPNIKALYDIGISGPLAGLVPTLVFMVIGIALSEVGEVEPIKGSLIFGEPFLFSWVSSLFFDRSVPGTDLLLHPIGMAAWTGLFITSLNLFPLGQLDGGHVFYALTKRYAGFGMHFLFYAVITIVILTGSWEWSLMIILLFFIGIKHPATADDTVPLGKFRTCLGWLVLVFLLIGFTPHPISEPVIPSLDLKPLYSLFWGGF